MAIATMLTLLGACGGPSPESSSPGESTAGPGPIQSIAPEGYERLIAAGEEPDDAAFLVLTTFEVTPTGPRSARVLEHLASGDTVAFDVSVEPGVAAVPGLTAFEVDRSSANPRVHFEYFVGGDTVPADDGALLGPMDRPGLAVAALGVARPAVFVTADGDGGNVVVDWTLSKAGDEARDASIEAFLTEYAPGRETTLMKLVKAGFAANEGLGLGGDLEQLLDELKKLEDCARNPTNPLTKRLYEQSPGERDRILREIDDARSDVILNTIVMQLGVLNEFIADAGPKWLGWAISPGTAWSKATLQDLNRSRLDELRRSIPKCEVECHGGSPDPRASGDGSSGEGDVCRPPLEISGDSLRYALKSQSGRPGDSYYATQEEALTLRVKLKMDSEGRYVDDGSTYSATVRGHSELKSIDCVIIGEISGSASGSLPEPDSVVASLYQVFDSNPDGVWVLGVSASFHVEATETTDYCALGAGTSTFDWVVQMNSCDGTEVQDGDAARTFDFNCHFSSEAVSWSLVGRATVSS